MSTLIASLQAENRSLTAQVEAAEVGMRTLCEEREAALAERDALAKRLAEAERLLAESVGKACYSWPTCPDRTDGDVCIGHRARAFLNTSKPKGDTRG